MISARPVKTQEFRVGDNVVLAEGPNQFTSGVFLGLREDTNWAEIKEQDGIVRCHPVIWLQQSNQPGKTVQGTDSTRTGGQ